MINKMILLEQRFMGMEVLKFYKNIFFIFYIEFIEPKTPKNLLNRFKQKITTDNKQKITTYRHLKSNPKKLRA